MHLYGQGCPICRNIKSANSRRLNTNKFIQKSKIIHGDKYDYSKTSYIEMNKKVCMTCREHGDFLQLASDHLKGKGCPKCANNSKHTAYEFINLAK